MVATFYFIVVCAAAAILITLSFVGWTRRSVPAGMPFFLLMASSAFYLLCNVGFMVSADRETAYVFARLQTLGTNLACVVLLVFCVAYSGRPERLPRLSLAFWYALAVGTFLVVWTDPYHHWYFRTFEITQVGGLTFRAGTYGWWLPVLIVVQFIPPLYGVAVLIAEYRAAQGVIRRQYRWLIFTACLPPGISALIAVLRMVGVESLSSITPLPLAFGAVGLSTVRVILRDQLLDLTPIAQVLIFDEIPEAIIITDLQGRITQLNPVARRLRGLKPGEGIGRLSRDLFVELDGVDQGSIITVRLPDEARPRSYECRFRDLKRKEMPVGRLTILYDVTERQRAEEAYRSVVDRSLQGFAIFQEGRAVFANRMFGDLFGYEPAEVLNFSAEQLVRGVHPDDLPRVLDGQRRLLTGEIDSVRSEFRIMRRALEPVWVEIQAARTDYRGAPAVQIALVDITEQKKVRQRDLEAQLERERAELVSGFVASAAHELRTPLSIINTQAYLLAAHADEAARKQRAALIESQVFRTSKLVDMMLKMVRLQRASPTLVALAPEALVKEVCSALLQGGLMPTLRCEIIEPLPHILGDSDLLQEALTALIDNARRYGPPDGSIVVRLCMAGESVCIAVHDEGPGIAADQMDKIFETFWRGDSAHSTPGMGLGLPIARRIVELHKGSIRVESAPEKGSIFRIHLPVHVET
ncbi:MAG: PAS domain S-box protein [Anaerolineae bacterium]|nr:PAS domain S-box protein [Anaerolineae bacterium]NUQ04318.1 PAS domain S-box protein [Anaerolineae bacterium]